MAEREAIGLNSAERDELQRRADAAKRICSTPSAGFSNPPRRRRRR